MRSTTILLPLFALVPTMLAAPAIQRPVIRAVPEVKAVIRNPAPVDHRLLAIDIDLSALRILDNRATPAINKEIAPPVDVVKRAKPSIEKEIAPPVDVVKRAKPSIEKEITSPVDIVS